MSWISSEAAAKRQDRLPTSSAKQGARIDAHILQKLRLIRSCGIKSTSSNEVSGSKTMFPTGQSARNAQTLVGFRQDVASSGPWCLSETGRLETSLSRAPQTKNTNLERQSIQEFLATSKTMAPLGKLQTFLATAPKRGDFAFRELFSPNDLWWPITIHFTH